MYCMYACIGTCDAQRTLSLRSLSSTNEAVPLYRTYQTLAHTTTTPPGPLSCKEFQRWVSIPTVMYVATSYLHMTLVSMGVGTVE